MWRVPTGRRWTGWSRGCGPWCNPEVDAIDPRLLAILACPKCKGALRPVESENTLRCGDCGSSYLVNADGVPIMTFTDD
ncbi:MAG: hypothetical protein OXC98_07170 [bacterium]|nr:hypothetical protein [Acidimicrobiia bacterium]MCY4650133.1 hypothetical protein [bacterium]